MTASDYDSYLSVEDRRCVLASSNNSAIESFLDSEAGSYRRGVFYLTFSNRSRIGERCKRQGYNLNRRASPGKGGAGTGFPPGILIAGESFRTQTATVQQIIRLLGHDAHAHLHIGRRCRGYL